MPDPDPHEPEKGEAPTLRTQVLEVCRLRGWSLHWTHRSADPTKEQEQAGT